jgi:hypothetical protein
MIRKPIRDRRRAKQDKRTKRKKRRGKLVETAAAEEIVQGGLRQHFLDDFHRYCGKPCWVYHSYHKLGGGYSQHFKSTGDDNHLIQ